MSMFSQFSFRPLDETSLPQAQRRQSSPPNLHSQEHHQQHPIDHSTPFESSDDEYEPYHSSAASGYGSGRQSRSSLTALAEEEDEEDAGNQGDNRKSPSIYPLSTF
ncbi:hypothetical protein I317_04501 [Kwoniella heveanensis CBS 569]|nr:hypothetical protein I317_04501 [Kwoniella heveanensis CBS 569]